MNLINVVDSFSKNVAGIKPSVGGNIKEKDTVLKNEGIVPGTVKDEPGRDEVVAIVGKLNEMSSIFNDNIIRFTMDDKTNSIVVKVIDSETDEIIREIPNKHSRELLEHFKENLGVLIDKSI